MSLTQNDYAKAAEKLGVDVASVRAVASVESKGSGFFKPGFPAILYERHIFYRELLTKRNNETKARIKYENSTLAGTQLDVKVSEALRAVKNEMDKLVLKNSNICNQSPGGYLGGIKEYDRLAQAVAIDEECANRSCSWGAFQIMGFHAEFLGYKNVMDFVAKMKASEAEQLNAFCTFIQKNPSLLKALKAKNWATFAKFYNGADYAKNSYDTKLAAAFNTYTENPNLA